MVIKKKSGTAISVKQSLCGSANEWCVTSTALKVVWFGDDVTKEGWAKVKEELLQIAHDSVLLFVSVLMIHLWRGAAGLGQI